VKIRHVEDFWPDDLKERDNLEVKGSRWEDNIKVDLREILCEGVESIQLARDQKM
jgi:hypothetical protein